MVNIKINTAKIAEIKIKLKENKKFLKEVWNGKDNNPNWRNDYRDLKNKEEELKKELNELENGKEVRIWTKCKLFGCENWTERMGWGIPDLLFKRNKPGVKIVEGNSNEVCDWAKFEEVEKCESCVKLTEKEIYESKKHNKMWSEVGDELTEREIKNHGWAK